MKSVKGELKERTVYNLCEGCGHNFDIHPWGILKRDLGGHLSRNLWVNLCIIIWENLKGVL